MSTEITVGIAGAAGDGLDRSGDTLARTAARLGLHVFTYNAYQSLIRGGHTWLKLRLSEKKVDNHGDGLNVLIALNQDSIERHAREVEPGGAILFNSARLTCDPALVPEGVTAVPLPIPELTKDLGRLLPVMQNTVALGALLHLTGLDVEVMAEILTDTFKHKGEEIVAQNVPVRRAGYDQAVKETQPLKGYDWTFSRKRRPVITGNQLTDQESGDVLDRATSIRRVVAERAYTLPVSPESIDIEPADGGGPEDVVTITLTYSYDYAFPGLMDVLPAMRFSVAAAMRNEPFYGATGS